MTIMKHQEPLAELHEQRNAADATTLGDTRPPRSRSTTAASAC